MLLKNILSISTVNVFKAVLQLALNIIIARFVSPGEFGLVTFALPFITFIALLTDLGISSALVRQARLDRRDAGAAMSLITSVGLGFAIVLAILGNPIERWANMAGLTPVLVGLAVSTVLSVAAIAPRAMLERELRFQVIAAVECASAIAAALSSILSLYIGGGIFSLVVYYIVLQLLRSGLFLTLARRDMELNFNWRAVMPMMAFGGWVLASNVLSFIARNGDNILIGAFLGAGAVGLYGLAYQVMILPLMVVAWPASGILMATLSREARDGDTGERKAAIMTAFLSGTALLTIPGMAYLSFGGPFLIDTFLGERWKEASQLIVILAPVGALQSLSSYVGAVLLSAGKPGRQFWWGAINSVIFLIVFLAALPFGLVIFAYAYAATAALLAILSVVIICVEVKISARRLFVIMAPPVLATGIGLVLATLSQPLFDAAYKGWFAGTGLYIGVTALCYLAMRQSIHAHIVPLFSVHKK